MGTAARSAPLRRTGSLLGLLGLELAAVLGLHWLGRLAGLRIRWDAPVPWLLSSPVQEILGALARTVGLVMAYWLLASTVLYLLASLTRLPSAVRAVRWATLPLVRRVADHAVAVTLATSMVGGATLGVAGPAVAAQDPAPSSTAPSSTQPADPLYRPHPAGHEPESLPAPAPAAPKPAAPKPETPPTTVYRPHPASDGPSSAQASPTPPTSAGSSGVSSSGSSGAQPKKTPPPKTGQEPGGERDSHEVRPGDNLWTIARNELERQRSGGSGKPSNREVAEYWAKVVEANRHRLKSHDPDLIFPREKVILPPVD
jgi:hypothetical protein